MRSIKPYSKEFALMSSRAGAIPTELALLGCSMTQIIAAASELLKLEHLKDNVDVNVALKHPELREKIRRACQTRSFSHITDLDKLQKAEEKPGADPATPMAEETVAKLGVCLAHFSAPQMIHDSPCLRLAVAGQLVYPPYTHLGWDQLADPLSGIRIYSSTTEDKLWTFTGHPSEPLLSSVAAILLHRTPNSLANALMVLNSKVDGGMVEIGQSGELASRLLLLFAKDLFIRKGVIHDELHDGIKGAQLIDCQKVSVIDFLEYLFGKMFVSKLAEAMVASQLAYINFSHWVSMTEFISPRVPFQTLAAGKLTIVDLSDPSIDPGSACGLFEIVTRLFVRAEVETGKVLVVDEAHKYLSTNRGVAGLTKALLTLTREQRHLGMRDF